MPTKLAGALALAAVLVLGVAASASASWSLVWADEFNGASLDLGSWSYDIGTGCPNLCGWGNNELEYYRSQNVAVTGGNLVITAKAESYGGAAYTSGKVTTRGKQTFLYGRVEMRAKLPVGGGLWPAFWMMPQDDAYGGWAASGEIDIMESANGMTFVGGALHYGGTWPDNTSTSGSTTLGGASFADAFHVYAVEWEPDAIRWYVDDTLFMTRTSAQWYSSAAPGNARAPFDQPFYILLNLAVGGNYTGCTSSSCVTASLPQQYLVDYVRVYEDIPNALPTVAITAPTAGTTLPAGDIAITATAADSDGTIAAVEFYDGAALLGTDTTAPYAFTWSGVGDGCYTIIARAIDDLGGTAEAAADITVGLGCGQLAYPSGTPHLLPGVVQAEDYDQGGEGVAYHDTDATNSGSQYRTGEGVDIEACSDTGGGWNVGWMVSGEWLEYTVQVPAAGVYTVEARVSSQSAGGSFRLEFGGVDRTGSITVPVTGGWQTWTTVSATMNLEAGTQVMRFVATATDFNLNSFTIAADPLSPAPLPSAGAATLLPAYPNPFNPSTTIAFELEAPAGVTLGIYDVAGRLVRTLVAGEVTGPGRHEATWDGRDAGGRTVEAGVYLCRLQAAGQVLTRRMTLLK